MYTVLCKKEAQLIDSRAINEKYITKQKLMDNAGKLSAQFFLEKIKDPFNAKVLVLAGKGDNGGDAIIMHHYLRNYGVDSKLYIFHPNLSKSLIKHYEISKKYVLQSTDEISFDNYDWFIDGIFGIGLNRKIGGAYKKIIESISKRNIISIDIPSGIECDSGTPLSDCYISPSYVLSMGYYKYANIINEGEMTFNKTYVLDIGLPLALKSDTFLVNSDYINRLVKKDKPLRNKYSQVCSAIVGSSQYSGAGILSISAALNMGASYIKSIIPSELSKLYSSIREPVIYPIGEKGYLSNANYHSILKVDPLYKDASILVGPGLGNKKTTIQLISKIFKYLKKRDNKCIFDASAFEPLYNGFKVSELPAKCILTPHLGEFKKIFPDIDVKNPIEACKRAHSRMGSRVLVLKGPFNIILNSLGKCYIVNNGMPLLATAGSGDVLSGIILGLLSKGYNIDDSAILGVYIHGLCSEIYAKKYSRFSMPSSDIVKILPSVLNEVLI